jgi:hypothetical protein
MRISLSRGPSLGLGLSLLVHAAVLAWLAHLAPFSPAPDAPPARMQVRLLRLPPPRPAAEPRPAPAAPAPAAPRTKARSAPRPVKASPDRPAQPAPEPAPIIALPPNGEASTQTQAAAPEGGAAGFEMQAARGTARAWIKGEGRGRGGADGLGTPMRPSRSEQFGQALERARRADCRGAYAGMGLLAVIPLAKDAVTGTGCKW